MASFTETPKLTYFNIRARAFCYKLTLAAGGIEQETINVTMGEWPDVKPKCKFGQMPIVEFRGKQVAQSAAIERLAARIAGLYPKNIMEQAHVDEIYEQLRDVDGCSYAAKFTGANFGPTDNGIGFVVSDDAAQKAGYKAQFKKAMQLLEPLEKMLEKSKTGYFLGKPTYVDIKLYTVLDQFSSAGFDEWKQSPAFLKNYKLIPNLGYVKNQLKASSELITVHKPGSHSM